MHVELLCNGGYTGMNACIGKQFNATSAGKGAVRIPIDQLELAGFINDGCVNESLYFHDAEVRVIDG